ncbi:MAG TPA: chloride channel protein [Acidimicrobiales bacterium]|nr:chloride channel protein [Acidimicrobiales bacterium]
MWAPTLPPAARAQLPSPFAWKVAAAGVVGGVIGAAYLAALMVIEHLLGPEAWSPVPHIVVLAAVGATVALIVRVLGPTRNVELLVDDIHVMGGTREVRSLRSLLPISLLCVGSGGTLGPEAPLVQATGAVGGWLATRWGLDRRHLRVLTITGMAAGFTALFGSPIGAAVFALEIPHRRGLEYADALMPAFVGSIAGYAVYVVATGSGLEPIFDLPGIDSITLADLGWSVAAGVASAVVAYAFTAGVRALRWVTTRLPTAARPVLGGLGLGLLALVDRHALTNGEAALHDLLVAKVAAGTLLVAAGVKLAGAVVAVAGEWRGGFIIPLFFVGATLGAAAHVQLPGTNKWVLVTTMMVGCNAAVTKTPLGSTLVVTEMAGVRLLPTALIAALVALALTGPIRLIESQRRRDETADRGDADAQLGPEPAPDIAPGPLGAP